jgi:hypothetical protein
MGTSASSKGPNSRSPLVPPHADADPEKPLPEPEGQRFRGFRTEFGRAAAGGGVTALKSALGKYARDATHGTDIGPRRFGPAYTSGATLALAFAELAAGGSGQNATGVDLSRFIGQPLDVAAQEIARALAPANVDADQITAAIQEALAEVLPDAEVFDPTLISADQLVQILVEFFSRILFQEITSAAGDAWNKAPDAQHATQTEADLLELVRVIVDKHLSPRLVQGLTDLSRDQITALERAAVNEIWREWESYQ